MKINEVFEFLTEQKKLKMLENAKYAFMMKGNNFILIEEIDNRFTWVEIATSDIIGGNPRPTSKAVASKFMKQRAEEGYLLVDSRNQIRMMINLINKSQVSRLSYYLLGFTTIMGLIAQGVSRAITGSHPRNMELSVGDFPSLKPKMDVDRLISDMEKATGFFKEML